MQIFKLYFKILKNNLGIIMMYVFIFLIIAVLNLSSLKKNNNFEYTKLNVVVYNYDEENDLIKYFVKYLTLNTNIITDIKDNKEEIDNALFYEQIDTVIRIPKGFSSDLINNHKTSLELSNRHNSAFAYLTNILVEKYFNFSEAYEYQNYEEMLEVLNKNIAVELLANNDNSKYSVYYFNALNYVIIALSIYIFGLTLNTINQKNIKNRNQVSPISDLKFNLIFLFGNILLMSIIIFLFVLFGLILLQENLFKGNNINYILNLYIFLLPIYIISYIVGKYISSKQGISAISNILSLGSSFLCGAFVPQEYLSKDLLNISKVMPSYWFVKNNYDIYENNFRFNNIIPFLIFILIFFAVFMLLNLKQKKLLKNNDKIKQV